LRFSCLLLLSFAGWGTFCLTNRVLFFLRDFAHSKKKRDILKAFVRHLVETHREQPVYILDAFAGKLLERVIALPDVH